LVSSSGFIEDFSALGPLDVLALEQHNQPQVEALLESPTKRGRKRKHPQPEEEQVPVPQPEVQSESDFLGPDMIRDNQSDFVPSTPAPIELKGDLGLDNQTFDNDSIMPPPATPNIHQISTPNHSTMMGMSVMPPTPMPPTPSLSQIPMTPGNLDHGSMTPFNSHHGNLDDNPMLSDPALNNLDAIPLNPLNPETVSSILDDAGGEMDHFANMGYDGHGSPGGGISERIANDWNDYDYPASVGRNGDEQMVDETIEQFEERVLNKRAAQLFVSVRAKLQKENTLYLSEMTYKNTKKQAAQKFYSLLVLKKFQVLEIKQEQPYADICVSRGEMFENPTL
jgi:cohesin complex subunit SCC1